MSFEPYFLLKLAHILLFVYWLGADIGVFHSAGYVRNRELGLEARRTALQILGWIDQIPRYCLVLMLPVGYSLAAQLGVARMPGPFYVILWAIALVWLWTVWAIHHYQGQPLAEKLRRVDLYWRWVLAAGLCYDAWEGFRGTGHLLTDWISAKFLIFALLIFCGIMIRVRGKPLGPALRQLLASGSTPELETVITGTFARTRPFVLSIWVLLIVAAWTGITKPQFGG
jgi:hypothetical protein